MIRSKTLIAFSIGLLLSCSLKVLGQVGRNPSDNGLTTKVSVVGNPIQVIKLESGRSDRPSIDMRVKNISDKAIRGISLIHQLPEGNRRVLYSALESFFEPGATPGGTYFYPQTFRVANVGTLSVDFVIFVDGTTWGADAMQGSLALNERREGSRASTKWVRDFLDKNDRRSLLELFEREPMESCARLEKEGSYRDWNEFRYGCTNAIYQLRWEKNNIKSLEARLQRMEKVIQ